MLLKAALAHMQFETIHPFLDSNGRLGCLLTALLLCEQKVLREPMLYLSLYFKTHRQYYYELLNNVRMTGDWETWLDFFAEAVIVTATQAVETAQQLLDLSKQDRDKISGLGRAAGYQILHAVDQFFLAHQLLSGAGKMLYEPGYSVLVLFQDIDETMPALKQVVFLGAFLPDQFSNGAYRRVAVLKVNNDQGKAGWFAGGVEADTANTQVDFCLQHLQTGRVGLAQLF